MSLCALLKIAFPHISHFSRSILDAPLPKAAVLIQSLPCILRKGKPRCNPSKSLPFRTRRILPASFFNPPLFMLLGLSYLPCLCTCHNGQRTLSCLPSLLLRFQCIPALRILQALP